MNCQEILERIDEGTLDASSCGLAHKDVLDTWYSEGDVDQHPLQVRLVLCLDDTRSKLFKPVSVYAEARWGSRSAYLPAFHALMTAFGARKAWETVKGALPRASVVCFEGEKARMEPLVRLPAE